MQDTQYVTGVNRRRFVLKLASPAHFQLTPGASDCVMRDPMNCNQPLLKCFSVPLLFAVLANQWAVTADENLPEVLAEKAVDSESWLPDFSYAGYRNGAEPLPVASGTVIEVDDFGAVANDDNDDTKAILAALVEAHSEKGPVIVRFSAGRYRVTEILKIERSNIVVQGQGSGPGGTTLWFPRPLNQVDKSSSLDELRKYLVDLDKRQREPARNIHDFFSSAPPMSPRSSVKISKLRSSQGAGAPSSSSRA